MSKKVTNYQLLLYMQRSGRWTEVPGSDVSVSLDWATPTSVDRVSVPVAGNARDAGRGIERALAAVARGEGITPELLRERVSRLGISSAQGQAAAQLKQMERLTDAIAALCLQHHEDQGPGAKLTRAFCVCGSPHWGPAGTRACQHLEELRRRADSGDPMALVDSLIDVLAALGRSRERA